MPYGNECYKCYGSRRKYWCCSRGKLHEMRRAKEVDDDFVQKRRGVAQEEAGKKPQDEADDHSAEGEGDIRRGLRRRN
eukprot:9384746-Pyramimonas_sp.AAC.1